jgi:hypothetical protein
VQVLRLDRSVISVGRLRFKRLIGRLCRSDHSAVAAVASIILTKTVQHLTRRRSISIVELIQCLAVAKLPEGSSMDELKVHGYRNLADRFSVVGNRAASYYSQGAVGHKVGSTKPNSTPWRGFRAVEFFAQGFVISITANLVEQYILRPADARKPPSEEKSIM